MSLIKEVRSGVLALDLSTKSLRQFGMVVGGILFLLAGWLATRGKPVVFYSILGGVGLSLVFLAVIQAKLLSSAYRVWMGLAFVLGWVMSRLLLTIFFFVMVTPIGLVARIFGKEFLSPGWKRRGQRSYWVPRSGEVNYEKMY